MSLKTHFKEVAVDTSKTAFMLFKILIPVSIIVKILAETGFIEKISNLLNPVMGVVGLPGDFSLVWATTLVTNLYGGMIVFFNLSLTNTYSVAEVTVLASMMLVAHTLPVEIRIAQKAGVKARFMILFRISCAIIFGFILHTIFTSFNLYEEKASVVWQPSVVDPTLTEWAINELRNYAMIFLIIFSLLVLMKILKETGVINKLNNALEPGLKVMGMSKDAAPVTIIGLTLGISYGGGLIVKEVKDNMLAKKDAFLSLSLMGLSHSLIEDTLLMLAIGASVFGILLGRVIFTLIIMIILIKAISCISEKKFIKFFTK